MGEPEEAKGGEFTMGGPEEGPDSEKPRFKGIACHREEHLAFKWQVS